MARRVAPSLLQSPEFVRLALAGVEQEIEQTRERLSKLQAYAAQLRGSARGVPVAPAVASPAAGKSAKARRAANRLSPEARKALAERMRRKWAEFRKAKDQAAAKPSKKSRRATSES